MNDSHMEHQLGQRQHRGPIALAGTRVQLSWVRLWPITAQGLFSGFSLCRISRLPGVCADAQITFLSAVNMCVCVCVVCRHPGTSSSSLPTTAAPVCISFVNHLKVKSEFQNLRGMSRPCSLGPGFAQHSCPLAPRAYLAHGPWLSPHFTLTTNPILEQVGRRGSS